MKKETRIKMSKAKMGHVVSKETRAKISLTQLSHSKEISSRLMGHTVSEETRAKLRLAGLGRALTKECALKISKALKGRIFSEKHRTNLSLACTGKILSEEHKAQLRIYRLGSVSSKKTRAKLGKASKQRWNNITYKNRVVKAIRLALLVHPNKPETVIMNMLESICPGEFKFVGDGQVIIAGKNPDFININGHKQIIELFGDYWHQGENPKNRIKLFKQYGFDTLVIWERELRTPSKVANRITNFTKRNCFERLLKEN